MKKVLLALQLALSTVAYGQKVEMTWEGSIKDPTQNKFEIPSVYINEDENEVIVQDSEENTEGVITLRDDNGQITSRQHVLFIKGKAQLPIIPDETSKNIEVVVLENRYTAFL